MKMAARIFRCGHPISTHTRRRRPPQLAHHQMVLIDIVHMVVIISGECGGVQLEFMGGGGRQSD